MNTDCHIFIGRICPEVELKPIIGQSRNTDYNWQIAGSSVCTNLRIKISMWPSLPWVYFQEPHQVLTVRIRDTSSSTSGRGRVGKSSFLKYTRVSLFSLTKPVLKENCFIKAQLFWIDVSLTCLAEGKCSSPVLQLFEREENGRWYIWIKFRK